MKRKAVIALLPLLVGCMGLTAHAQVGYRITDTTGDPRLNGHSVAPGEIVSPQGLQALCLSDGSITCQKIAEGYPEEEITLTFSRGAKRNCAPVAEDSARETYKNLPITAALKVRDPEGQPMTYTLTRAPRRGVVVLNGDGTFTYTPKQNKVGVDSFAYTASDGYGAESREATVTITIIRPMDDARYTDTEGSSCCFAAQWMKSTGIFVGESVDGNETFFPEKSVTRGELLAMAVKTLELPTQSTEDAAWLSAYPAWLKPYLAAAMRAGLVPDLAEGFRPEEAATSLLAADMLCNGLHLAGTQALQTDIAITGKPLTRADAAELMYDAHKQMNGGRVKILG